MTRSPRSPLRPIVLLVLAAATLSLGACGTTASQAGTSSTTVPTDPGSPVLVLESPGDGETITISVGDRIQVPAVDGPGGIVLGGYGGGPDDLAGLLAREGEAEEFGDGGVYRAVGPGELTVLDTVYDPERSCVPPKVVATFTLVITGDPALESGAAAEAEAGGPAGVAAPTCGG